MANISEINHPVEKFVAFISEREAIRIRRHVMKKEWPWTDDPILQQYRFTNVHREDDAVSKHYQNIVRDRYGDSSLVLPATVIYRWFNRPWNILDNGDRTGSSCEAIFGRTATHPRSIFDLYINSGSLYVLQDCISQLEPPYVTGAYLIPSKPGYSKAEGVLQYIDEWMQRDWHGQWDLWRRKGPPLLSEMYEWLNGNGLGSFMRGQIIADLKYVQFMLKVPDWWIWATPGPGSMKGLNIVIGRDMNTPWHKGEWLATLESVSEQVTPLLAGYGMEKLHNQDLQNCLCEWSKYTKVATGQGRPRQIFRNTA
jgi:hypothetical protein